MATRHRLLQIIRFHGVTIDDTASLAFVIASRDMTGRKCQMVLFVIAQLLDKSFPECSGCSKISILFMLELFSF